MDSDNNKTGGERLSKEEIDKIVAKARRLGENRLKSYREQSLKIHPWVCARCGREFTHKNIHLLTVHHKDHNHDNNPADGSNWENLCVYCHDNEHRRYLDHIEGEMSENPVESQDSITHKPFAALGEMLNDKNDPAD
jgi:hypothetical protein